MTDTNKLINQRVTRVLEIANPQETDTGLVIEIAASSDIPYMRQFGYETLLHTDEAVDYTRVTAGSCPLLYNHKNDEYIGIVEKVWITNGQLRAIVRLSKNSELSRQVSADILDGILRSISIGYEINQFVEGKLIDEVPQYIATKWTLYEISVVTTPADYQKAGIGRSDHIITEDKMNKKDFAEVMAMVDTLTEEEKAELLTELVDNVVEPLTEAVTEEIMDEEVLMEEEVMEEAKATRPYDEEGNKLPEEKMKTAPKAKSRSIKGDKMSKVDVGSDNGAENIAKLADIAAKYNRTAELATWVREGRSAADVALEIVAERSNESKVSAPAIHVKKNEPATLATAVKSWLQGSNSELAERGLDQARASGRSINPSTLYIPTDVPMIRAGTAYANTGKNATGNVYQTFEETLREGALLAQAGGQILTLNDVSSMPYFSVPTTASVNLHETGSVTEDEVEVGLRTWTPKRIAARYVFSNLLNRLNGTYDFEAELYNDLVAEGVRQFDAQIWGGNGTLEILGLSRDTNIVALNLTGSMNLASASAMITQVASANANVANGVFVVDHQVFSSLFSTPSFGAGSGESVLTVIQASNPVIRTGYLPEVVSAKKVAMFGDFSKVTAAMFGPVEIKRDDLTKAQTGQTVLQLEMFADCVARQPQSLVRWTNVTP
jgi:HK97 family phage prohead protease